MKKFYLLIAVFALFFVGCSSTYRVSDYSSKDKFYEDFNKSTSDKTVKVTLNNDSAFTIEEGAKISSDTLFFTVKKGNINIDILPISRVKEISYKNHWLGVFLSSITGTIVGLTIGGLSGYFYETSIDRNDQNSTGTYMFFGIASIGLVTGGIWGWINGYTYNYQFNP